MLDYDCEVLPGSMNGGNGKKGCPAAVSVNGQPSKSYCKNTQGLYAWWAACCEWKDDKCVAKPTGNNI